MTATDFGCCSLGLLPAFPCSLRAGRINYTVAVPFLPWRSGTGGANRKKSFLLPDTFLRVCHHRNRKKLIRHSLTYAYRKKKQCMHIQRNSKRRKSVDKALPLLLLSGFPEYHFLCYTLVGISQLLTIVVFSKLWLCGWTPLKYW